MNTTHWLEYDAETDELSGRTLELIEEAAAATRELVSLSPKLNQSSFFTRGAHAKSYAFAEGIFTPEKELIGQMGLTDYFYDRQKLMIRFSNANNVVDRSGKDFPAYGMSLKFENGIAFPLVNFPLFPSNDENAILQVFTEISRARIAEATKGSALSELPALLLSAMKILFKTNPLHFGNLIAKGIQLNHDFLMNYSYHGIGCFRFGNFVAKIHTEKLDFEFENDLFKDSQAAALQKILDEKDIAFDLYIQPAVDAEKTPVNVLTREWDRKASPLLKFGRIEIPNQIIQVNSDELEAMSFSPFLNEKILQPVGRIQQTRKKIYEISAVTRNGLNQSEKLTSNNSF